MELREKIRNSPKNKIHDIELTSLPAGVTGIIFPGKVTYINPVEWPRIWSSFF